MLKAASYEREFDPATVASTTFEAMPYTQWIAIAMQRLQAQWPSAEQRRLHDIADELFADPRSGTLDPQQAVEHWLGLLNVAPERAGT